MPYLPENGKGPMANVLPREKRIAVLAALVEGNSERAVERMTGVNRITVGRLNLAFGLGAQRIHDRIAVDLPSVDIEADEVWSYVYVKEARVRADHPAGSGEAYTFTGLDKPSRFAIAWHTGKRDAASADAFTADLRARLIIMPRVVTDGFVPYQAAIGQHFGRSVDFAQTVKNYRGGKQRDDDRRYEPARGIDFITKKVVYGAPDLRDASTAHVERNNATMRHRIGRMRRLVYAFSKRLPNLRAAVALNYCWYNLGSILRTTRTTPAMAIGVTDHLWSLEEFHDAITAEVEPVEKPRAKPLTHRTPSVPARELPSGRGFLRLVSSNDAPTPSPAPATPPVAPVPAAAAGLRFDATGQADLFSWAPRARPLPPPGTQLSLFGEDDGDDSK